MYIVHIIMITGTGKRIVDLNSQYRTIEFFVVYNKYIYTCNRDTEFEIARYIMEHGNQGDLSCNLDVQ